MLRLGELTRKLVRYKVALLYPMAFFVFGSIVGGTYCVITAVGWSVWWLGYVAIACAIAVFMKLSSIICETLRKLRAEVRPAVKNEGLRWIISFSVPWLAYPVFSLLAGRLLPQKLVNVIAANLWYPILATCFALVHLLIERHFATHTPRAFLLASIILFATTPLVLFLDMFVVAERLWGLAANGMMIVVYAAVASYSWLRAEKVFFE